MKTLISMFALLAFNSGAFADVSCVAKCITKPGVFTVAAAGRDLSEAQQNLNAACEKKAETFREYERQAVVFSIATTTGSWARFSNSYPHSQFDANVACKEVKLKK